MGTKNNFNDFWEMSWDEFNDVALLLGQQITDVCKKNSLSIDFIVPIFRGGGILGIYLSHILNVLEVRPIQFKYSKHEITNDYVPILIWNSLPSNIKTCFDKKVILITEGNHCTGQTAQQVIDLVKIVYPNAKIIYCSIGRDHSSKEMNNTFCELYGFETNELETLNKEECIKLGIKPQFSIYPWENAEEEISEVTSSLQYHSKKESNLDD